MAPAAASLLSATSAAAGSKRPAASDAEPLAQGDQEAARKNQQQQLECPRCGSGNTKFCYYNNYSTAQPRHFCRACRRYWTHGGTLRNVPVGGACRRGGNKRRRVGSGADQPPSASPTPPTSTRAEDAYPDLPTTFPFLSDGVFLPQFDLGGVGPAGFSWPSAPIPDFYDGLAAPWGDGTLAAGVTGARDDITGLELSWSAAGRQLM